MKKSVVAWSIALICTACDDGARLSPVAPGETALSDSIVAQDVRMKWSPYIGVHVTGQALPAYLDALAILRRFGRVKGVRVEISKQSQNPSDPIIKAIGGLGLELLGLVGNEYLFEPNIEQEIDGIFAAYPEIRYFQIGNEATTILPRTGPTITIEGYMAVFQRIYDRVQQQHPGRAILLTQSTLGSGLYGAGELERMAALGLARMDPNKVIVAINAYDPDSVNQYRGLLGGALQGFRVWVTESGVADPALHASFVRERYPLLRDYLRSERMYWYVLWGGDSGNDADFSLIKNPTSFPNYWRSPLFTMLARSN